MNQKTTIERKKKKINKINKSMFYMIYRHLLLNKNLKETLNYIDTYSQSLEINLTNDQKEILIECLQNENRYKDIIQKNLVKWNYERLPSIDRAILLIGIHYIENNILDAILTINICVEYTKEFSDEKSYAYINAILDKVAKEKGLI